MIFKDDESKIIFNKDGVKGFLLNNANGCEYVKLKIDTDCMVEPHSLDFPVTFYILEGFGNVKIEDNDLKWLEPGDLIEVAPNLQRSFINNGDNELIILAIKHIDLKV